MESKVKDGNYYVVQSFMVKDLQLKGLEKDIYAIIYGFSQAEKQVFNGSLQYLADWTNSSKQGIMKCLKNLQDKGLIGKNEKNNGNLVEYYATEFNSASKLSLTPTIKQSLTNNIEDNNKLNNIKHIKEENINKKKKKFTPPTFEEVVKYAKSRDREDLAKMFFDYYTADTDRQWVDSRGNKVSNWKGKFITWENRNKVENQTKKVKYEDGSDYE